MVNHSDFLDATFSALSDSTRRRILKRLAAGDTAVSDLAGPFKMSLPAVIKHLLVLEKAGLVRTTKEGRVRIVKIQAAPMRKAVDWLNFYREFWEFNLDSLAAFLESETDSKSQKPKSNK